MRIPKMLGAQSAAVAANVEAALSGRLYRNDGDHPLVVTDLRFNQVDVPQRAKVHIVSTNGNMAWSKEPFPINLVRNEDPAGPSLVSAARWRLDYPTLLNRHDALGITKKNDDGSNTSNAYTVGVCGFKETEHEKLPDLWIPRVLFDERTSALTQGSEHTFDVKKLSNWGDYSMVVTAVGLFAYDSSDTEVTAGELAVRIKVADQNWMQDDNYVPLDAIRTHTNRQIRIPHVEVGPLATFEISIRNDHGSQSLDEIGAAVIGYVRVT